jgi:hypothetical protein
LFPSMAARKSSRKTSNNSSGVFRKLTSSSNVGLTRHAF